MGTAAGGGFPQWNCRCRYCEASRRGLLPPRLQASAAFSPDGRDWFVINATPDITTQLARYPELHPREGLRHTPMSGVLLTDAELDHTLGLLHLREGPGWTIFGAEAVLEMLEHDLRILPALDRYARPDRVVTTGREPLVLGRDDARVAVHWLETGRDPPRYAADRGAVPGAVSGLILEDLPSGRQLAYVPGAGALDGALLERLEEADAVYFDGTFWSDDEFPRVGGVPRTAKDMGHLPIGGPSGSAALLARLPARVKRYVHINNTNPALDPTSDARFYIRDLGLDLAEDGDELTIHFEEVATR